MPTWTAPYETREGAFDEALLQDGAPRPGYGPLIEAITPEPAAALDEVARSLDERGVVFGSGESRQAFKVDPLPRLFEAGEWDRVEAGLIQRVRALNLFLEDAYRERRIVEAGIVPARVLDESILYEPIMRNGPSVPVAHVAGPDLIRDANGRFRVLEDNLRTPSGLAYAIAGREAVAGSPRLPALPVRGLEGAYDLLRDTIRSADPTGGGDPAMALLSDGPVATAWYEHRELADRLGIPLVTPGDLETGDRLTARADGAAIEIDVLYNRSSSESLRDRNGVLTPLGTLLAGPIESGRLACVNSFGTGIADDKAAYCYVEAMIRFYLDEIPLLESVPCLDLGEAEAFATAIERIDELVFKPRWEFGGHGIVFGPGATAAELRDLETRLNEAPADYVAQEPVSLSVHPTVAGDRLEPRRVDFRPFVYTRGDDVTVLPGGLSRFAGSTDELVVNSTQGGGAKDTWVLL